MQTSNRFNVELLIQQDAEIQQLKQSNSLLQEELAEERDAVARAEERQRDAEADMLFIYCAGEGDDDDDDDAVRAQEEAARRLQEMKRQLDWMDQVAERLNGLLDESEEARAVTTHELSDAKQELSDAKQQLIEAKEREAAWKARWWSLTSVTQLQVDRLQRSQQDLKQRCELDSSDELSNATAEVEIDHQDEESLLP